jgi:glycine/D-amino acid oxidase-like deaminating enzyme
LKERAEVAIIGGGVHGLAIAYNLALRGIEDVVVLERSYIGSGASGRNAGGIRAQYASKENIAQAIREGYDDLELLKRYTGCFMGPCQGKQCLWNVLELFCRYTGRSLGDVRLTTTRPPIQPVSLGALAADG